jgi:hypothetical protein
MRSGGGFTAYSGGLRPSLASSAILISGAALSGSLAVLSFSGFQLSNNCFIADLIFIYLTS